jgi:hypothetical protein
VKNAKIYLLWGIFIAGGGFIISLIVTAGLLTGFMVPLVLSPELWRIPFGLLVISGLCIVVSVALLVIGLTLRTMK